MQKRHCADIVHGHCIVDRIGQVWSCCFDISARITTKLHKRTKNLPGKLLKPDDLDYEDLLGLEKKRAREPSVVALSNREYMPSCVLHSQQQEVFVSLLGKGPLGKNAVFAREKD